MEAGTGGDTPRRSSAFSATSTFGTQLTMALLSFGNVLVVGRVLGPEGRGSVAFLMTVGFMSSWLSTIGVDQSIGNVAGRTPAARRSLATNAVVLSALFGGATAAILLVARWLVPDVGADSSTVLYTIVVLSVPVLVLQIYLRQLAAADYRFGIVNATSVLAPLINVGVNLALGLTGVLSVDTAIVTWVGGQLTATLVLAWYVHSHLQGYGRPDAALARSSVRFGVRAHASHTMNLANYRADQWILGSLSSPAELGLYSVAVAWGEALFLLPQALTQVQRPDLVRATAAEAGERAAHWFRATLLVTLVASVGLILLAPVLCVTVFGSDFEGAVDDLRIVALGGFGIVALKMLGSALTAQGRPLRESMAVGVSFLTVVGLDFALIPSLGGAGAAIASAVGYTMGGVAVGVIFARLLGVPLRALVPGPGTVGDLRAMWRRVRPAS